MKKILKSLIFITLILFTLLSLKTKDEDELYGVCKDRFLACTQILLKHDNTFEYASFADVGGWRYWEGYWKKNGDTIILNTFKQPPINKELIETNDNHVNGTIIKLSLDSLKYSNIVIKVNDGIFVDTIKYNESVLIPNTIEINRIHIVNALNNHEGIILFRNNYKNKKLELFSLKASNLDDWDNYITNDKFLLKDDKLYYPIKDSEDYYYYLKRVPIEKKAFEITK